MYYGGTQEQWNSFNVQIASNYQLNIHYNYDTLVSSHLSETADIIASGYCGEYGNDVKWSLYNNGTLYIYGCGNMEDYENEIQRYDEYMHYYYYSPYCYYTIKRAVIESGVTGIGKNAFNNCQGLLNVYIPDTVTKIGERAFNNCSVLTDAVMPDGVTTIDQQAFAGCSGLTKVNIPSSVTSIGDYAFENCTALTSIDVDNDNNYYSSDNGVLYSKDKTILMLYPAKKEGNKYVIPSGVKSIAKFAFYSCGALTEITIPSSVTKIGGYAFDGCGGLKSITIPSGVTSIESSAFSECSSMTNVNLPSGLTNIGVAAFYDCTSLKSINIPDSVKTIKWWAFRNCSSLTSITIPSGVKVIESYLFEGCSNLTSITLPSRVTSIEGGAFEDCLSLTSVELPSSVKTIGSYAFEYCSSLTSITIPSETTKINSGAFYGCTGLTSVAISNSVTSINNYAFYNCKNLKDVYYNGTPEQWNTISIGTNNSYLTSASIHYQYTIGYDMNGGVGSIENQTKTHGQDLTLSGTIPTREGYTFVGWNTDKDAQTAQYQPNGKYTANSDAQLYAIWKIAELKNTSTINASEVTVGSSVIVTGSATGGLTLIP